MSKRVLNENLKIWEKNTRKLILCLLITSRRFVNVPDQAYQTYQ